MHQGAVRPGDQYRARRHGSRWPVLCFTALAASLLAGCATPSTPLEGASPADFGVDDDPVLGDPDAPVAIVAWEAPGCPSCAWFHANLLPDLQETYIDPGDVVFYYQQWTVGYAYDSFGGVALECIHREGGDAAFWPFLDYIFEQQHQVSEDDVRTELAARAEAHGMDREALLDCYDDQETLPLVEADIQAGRDAGARSSPAFIVIGPERVRGPVSVSGLEGAVRDATATA